MDPLTKLIANLIILGVMAVIIGVAATFVAVQQKRRASEFRQKMREIEEQAGQDPAGRKRPETTDGSQAAAEILFEDAEALFDSLTESGASVCLERDGSVKLLTGGGDTDVPRYAIDVVLHAPTKEETRAEYTMQDLREIVSFRNTSGDAWPSVCLRDYAQMHMDLLRASYGQVPGEDAFGENTRFGEILDGRTGEAVPMRRDPDDASVIWIDLAEPLAPGEQMQLYLTYAFPLVSDVDSGTRAVFGYSDSSGLFRRDGTKPVLTAGNFYPILAMYGEDGWNTSPGFDDGECFCSPVAMYEAAVAVPENWLVVTTGEEVLPAAADGPAGTGGEGGDTAAAPLTDGYACWREEARMVRDFALVAGEGLARRSETLEEEGVTVTATYYEGQEDSCDILLQSGVCAVKAFTEAFGPYPYETLDVVCCPLFGGGMEYPQIVFISDELVGFYKDFEQGTRPLNSTLAVVTAHEVGHNWFYGAVGNDEYREAWLDESFASYCEHVYRMYVSERGLGERYSWDDGETEVWAQSYGHDRYIDLPYDQMRAYQTTVYPYGCFFLLRLRRAMGDEAFTRAMHAFYQQNLLGIATTEDFLRAVRPEILQNAAAQQLCGQFLSQY